MALFSHSKDKGTLLTLFTLSSMNLMNYIVVFQGFFGKKLFIMYEIYFKRVAWSWPYTNYINLFFHRKNFVRRYGRIQILNF